MHAATEHTHAAHAHDTHTHTHTRTLRTRTHTRTLRTRTYAVCALLTKDAHTHYKQMKKALAPNCANLAFVHTHVHAYAQTHNRFTQM